MHGASTAPHDTDRPARRPRIEARHGSGQATTLGLRQPAHQRRGGAPLPPACRPSHRSRGSPRSIKEAQWRTYNRIELGCVACGVGARIFFFPFFRQVMIKKGRGDVGQLLDRGNGAVRRGTVELDENRHGRRTASSFFHMLHFTLN